MKLDELEQEVMELPLRARAKLARDIVRSLGSLSEEEVEGLWLDEAERRDQEMEATGDPGIPAAEVFARIRERLT